MLGFYLLDFGSSSTSIDRSAATTIHWSDGGFNGRPVAF
jgi:hypothetical protein